MNKKERLEVKRIKTKNRKLVKKYPWLIPKNVWTGKIVDDYDYEFTWFDDIPKGWKKAFGKMLLEDLDKASNGDINLQQIKEKYGSLRIYAGTTEEAQRVIRNYEIISTNVCLICGRPDVYMTTAGWIYPCCKKCWERNKNHKVPYEDVIEGENRMRDSYTIKMYKNGNSEERTYDICHTTNKIRLLWNKKHPDDEVEI